MPKFALNSTNPESNPFAFRGDCYICARGKGSIKVLREMGGKYEPVTNERGVELEWAADGGLAFNGHITCNARANHKIKATGDMNVTVLLEKS